MNAVAHCSRCGDTLTIVVEVDDEHLREEVRILRQRVEETHEQGEQIMGALQNLQAADVALKDEVTTFLQDIAGRLGGSSDADVQAVADDVNAEVAALQGGDPGAAPVVADPGTPVDGGDAPVAGVPAAE